MKREAASGLRRILEILIIQLQDEKREQSERSSMFKGTLVISMDIEDSPQHVNQSHCAAIISAKGDLCHKLLNDLTLREISGLLPFCQRGVLNGRGCPHESLHTMPLQLYFQLYEKSEVLKEDSIAMRQFIHRISLVHTTIKFHYCVKINSNISAETYSPEGKMTTCLPDGTTLLTDARHFMRSECRTVIPSCDKIHLVIGEQVSLFIPDVVVERGFIGELSLIPAASLCPCQKSFPKQPAKITAASIFLYDPAGLPILFSAEEVSYAFFEDPSSLASWGKYAYQATLNSAAYCKTGDRQMILSHLSSILFCSEQAVKRATQEVVNVILEQHYKAFQEQQKLAHALPIMASAISRIVSSSTDAGFRRKCLQSLQVADTQEFRKTITETFNKVILKQCKPSNACKTKTSLPRKYKTRQLTTNTPLSSVHQQLLCSCARYTGLEQGESARQSRRINKREGLLFDSSDFGEIIKTKKRKPANRKVSMEEDSEDISGEAKSEQSKGTLSARPDTTSASSFPCSSKSESDIFPDKSQGNDGDTRAGRSKNLCQEDDFWAEEVLNLTKWTS